MTATAPATPAGTGGGSLLRAELHRFSWRGAIRLMLLLAVLGLLAGTAVAFTQHAKATPEALAAAQQQADEEVRLIEESRQQCLSEGLPPESEGIGIEEWCGEPVGEYIRAADFLDPPPFDLAANLPDGTLAVGVLAGVLLFLVGTTYAGADWASRSIVALLFWEPRRLKVVATRAAVVVLAGVVVALVAQVLWTAAAWFLGATRGTTDVSAGFAGDLLAQQGRVVLLGVLAGLLGFGLTNLLRSTAGTLGVALAYLVVVENGVRALRPRWGEWLLTTNVEALLSEDGAQVYVYDDVTGEDRSLLVSNLQGGLVLTAVCLVVLVLSAWSFQRRDLQ
jgi:lysylphosphatidylglycerol synthetase-like protein (DUF2156 family)